MRTLRTTAVLALSALLAACGGSGGSSGPDQGAVATDPSMATGTVTGFGPTLTVDGVSYDASAATVSDDTDPASPAPASASDLTIGQQVELVLHGGRPTHVGINATLVGLIDPGSLDTTAGRFTVLDQAVTYSQSGDAATRLVGVKDASGLGVGRLVTVHGVVDATGAVAARLVVVMPKDAPLVQRVRGVAQGVDAAAKTLKIGRLTVGYAKAKLLPEGAVPADGDAVVVFSRQATTGTSPELLLAADTVRVIHARTQQVAVRLGGPVTAVTPVSGQAIPNLELAGLKVDASRAKLAAGTSADALVVGAVVRVDGTVEAGVVMAAEIAVVPREVEHRVVLVGQVSAFAGIDSFVVRGATVDGSKATFTPGSSAEQLADGVAVTVLGHVSGSVIVADQITVFLPPPQVPTTLVGVVSGLDAAAKTFRLAGLEMRLDAAVTYEGGVAADLLDGARVRVTGVFDGKVLLVKKVELVKEPARRQTLAGVVSGLDADSFVVDDTTVTVTSKTDVVNGPLADGQRVFVLAQAEGGAVVALRVEVVREVPPVCGKGYGCAVANAVHFTGAVSAITGAATFKVDGGPTIDASKAEFLPKGKSVADLAVGQVVTVGGTMSDGVVTATVVLVQ